MGRMGGYLLDVECMWSSESESDEHSNPVNIIENDKAFE